MTSVTTKPKRLVKDGHRLIVYIPADLHARLRHMAGARWGAQGQPSLGALVREVLDTAVSTPRGHTRK